MVLSSAEIETRVRRRHSDVACEPQRIGVVLPAHNEAPFLLGVIASIPDSVDRIYLVDDAGTDDTPTVVAAIEDPRLTYIRHEMNQGVGGAVVTGYRRALNDGCDLVVKMDADGQMDGREIERLLAPLLFGMADYVKGSRFYIAYSNQQMPQFRRLGSVALSFMTKAATGYWHSFDSQCGFTAIRASYLRLLPLDELAKDYFFENSMLLRLNVYDARVVDMPVSTIYGDEVSGIRYRRVLFSFPARLVAGWWKRFFRKYYLVDFGAIAALFTSGAILFLFGVVFGAVNWAMSAQEGVPTPVGTVMIATVPLIVGIQLLLQGLLLEVSNSPGAEASSTVLHEWATRLSLKPAAEAGGDTKPEGNP